MQKINFINGQSGGTPLSAENLNLMQANAENAINDVQENVEEEFNETVLFNNTAGVNTSITLSESAENFKYIEIFYCDEHNLYNSVKVYKPNGKSVDLHSFHAYSHSGTVISDTSEVKINGTQIIANSDEDKYGSWNSWNNSIAKTNHIYITRVVGYKN